MALGQEAVLSPGSTGLLVKRLQEQLAGAGFSPGQIDGIYGPQTQQAVIRFQSAKGLTPDGIAGPQVWAALNPAPAPLPVPAPPKPEPRMAILPMYWLLFGGVLIAAFMVRR